MTACKICGYVTQGQGHICIGRKDDTDKLRWDLLPESLEDVVKVLTFGAKKYSPDGWKQVPEAQPRYFAATMRHLWAWRRGEDLDPESGLPHLAHAACCVLFLGALKEKV